MLLTKSNFSAIDLEECGFCMDTLEVPAITNYRHLFCRGMYWRNASRPLSSFVPVADDRGWNVLSMQFHVQRTWFVFQLLETNVSKTWSPMKTTPFSYVAKFAVTAITMPDNESSEKASVEYEQFFNADQTRAYNGSLQR